MHVQSDDEIIVTRCLNGDQAAFAFLVNKYKGAVHAYAYLKVFDYQDAQDIVQEVFIKAYRKLAQLKWPHKFQSWLYTIAANECKLWLRSHSKEREQEVHLEDMPAENLDKLAVRNYSDEDIELTVRGAMETLPDNSRLAVSLYYMSDLSTKEVAGFMGISPNNVGVLLHRARKQLGKRLEKMIGKQLKKEKLGSGFVFKVADSIRDMPIPPLPKPGSTRWGNISVSVGIALLIGIIGYGVSSGKDVSSDMPILKFAKTPVEVSLIPELNKELGVKGSGENELLALNTEDSVAPEAGGNSHKEIVVQKVRLNEQVMGHVNISPSPDGRYLSFANGKNGNMAILDLTTGESRDLTDEGNWEGAQRHAISSTWSPDSKQIAYHWFNEDTQELRIVGLDGSKPRVLHPGEESKAPIYGCYDWSQDGKYILSWSWEFQRIMLISVDDGSIKTLKSSVPQPEGMSLSPDGRYVVYDLPVNEHEDLRDLFILTTDGSGQETRLTDHPADDHDPAWSPDGKSIVFASNRDPGGSVGLWLIQMADGKPVGEPQQVKKEPGDIRTLGFTEKGSLLYATMNIWSDIYIASVDMETGELLSKPELMTSQGILNTMPAWSPDGKSLAYLSERTAPGSFRPKTVLVIRSMETGEERELCPMPEINRQLRWSPDGRSILLGDRYNLHLVDIQTGDVTRNITTDTGEVIWHPAWSPDGKTIFFTRMRHGKEDWPCRIMALELETREERELYSGNSPRMFLAVSPDGRKLAFRDQEDIKIISTEGGEPHTLITREDLSLQDWPEDFLGAPFAWTPDGRYILFMIGRRDEQADWFVMHIWRVSAQGGDAKKLIEAKPTFNPAYMYPPGLHPDGQRIAFQKGRNREVELWIMENILSKSTANQ